MMFHGLMRGTNIFYRGYVIHEEIKAISYTIYGERPVRSEIARVGSCLLYTSPSPRDATLSRMPSSA